MQDFSDFYQFGGYFNHIVSLFVLAAIASLVMHATAPRRTDRATPLLRLCERFVALGVASGVLGSVFNMFELSAALATVPAELFDAAGNRGAGLVPIPLAWALMCAIPIFTATTCLRHRAVTSA